MGDDTPKNTTKRRHRGRRVLIIVMAVILVIAGGYWFVIKQNPGTTYAELDETDRTMFDELASVYRAFDETPGGLWTEEFPYEEEPLVLARTYGDRGVVSNYYYLVNMSDVVDTSGYTTVDFPDEPLLDDVVVTKTFDDTDLAFAFPKNFDYLDAGDKSVLGFKYHPGLVTKPGFDGLWFPTFSLHEAFHLYAQADWDDGGSTLEVPSDDEFARLTRTEFAALDALATTTGAERDAAARDVALMRLARYERWPSIRDQQDLERIEGIARYVEGRYLETLDGDQEDDFLPGELTAAVDKTFAGDDWIEFARSAYYSSGAIIAAALDDLRPDWKTLVDAPPAGEGLTPFDVLRDTTQVSAPPTDEELEEIVARYR